jgi:hypothetical protein
VRVRRSRSIRRALPLAAVVAAAITLGSASAAFAEVNAVPCGTEVGGHPYGCYWKLDARAAPTNLPLNGEGVITVKADNLGAGEISGETSPLKIADELPAGVEATAVSAVAGAGANQVGGNPTCSAPSAKPITCEYKAKLPTSEFMEVKITVKTSFAAPPEPLPNNIASVEGGGIPKKEVTQPLKVNNEPTPFGVESFELTPENEHGEPETQAGSHPYQLSTTFNLNQRLGVDPDIGPEKLPTEAGLQKDLQFRLPPGMIGDANVVGNPNAVQQCSDVDFGSNGEEGINHCPDNTTVGTAVVTVNAPEPNLIGYHTFTVPVFNLVPAPGEPAKFGFELVHVPVVLDTTVRSGEDYGVTVSVRKTSNAVQVLGAQVTFWGVPGDPRHDRLRGWNCLGQFQKGLAHGPCEPFNSAKPQPFLIQPTACGNFNTTVTGVAWGGETLSGQTKNPMTIEHCDKVELSPSLSIRPDEQSGSSPSGMTVEVSLPQESTISATGIAEGELKATTLALPREVVANAGAANGLAACRAQQLGFNEPGNGNFNSALGFPASDEGPQLNNNDFSPTLPERTEALPEPPCPQPAKIGTVEINTPVLPEAVTGSVYLGYEHTNPFSPNGENGGLVLYIVAEEKSSKTLVKLAGLVKVEEGTGQLVSTFVNTPPAPFAHLRLHLFNGPRASQATPARCKTYNASAQFTGWNEVSPGVLKTAAAGAEPGEGFQIASGCTPVGQALPFSPAVFAGATNTQAGAFTPFSLTIQHFDGQQAIDGLSMHLPQGAAAMLASVTPCPLAVADAAACGPASLIGHSLASSGLGTSPVTLPGEVFLTEGFDGAPFGVSVKTSAEEVGPFHIGTIIANSIIQVDPNTAAATITAVQAMLREPNGNLTALNAPLPTMIKGVPVQLKQITVNVDRAGFEFNPTNCSGQSITGVPLAVTESLSGAEGATFTGSSPYGVTGCASLPFTPKLTASAAGQGSKLNGTEFKVTVESSHGQANIGKTFLALPIELPSRLTTIQQACLEATFNKNPASCPEGSNIGFAVAHTPVLRKPLQGPAYLVSHGNASFPDVEFVLQGEGILLVLDGKTDIKGKPSITYSRFEAVPDAPVERFETTFPAGPHSALTANVPESEHFNLCKHTLSMPTEITGQNGAVLKQVTNVALIGCGGVLNNRKESALAKALKKCRKQFKHNKRKRASCEHAARKRYAKKASKHKKH